MKRNGEGSAITCGSVTPERLAASETGACQCVHVRVAFVRLTSGAEAPIADKLVVTAESRDLTKQGSLSIHR